MLLGFLLLAWGAPVGAQEEGVAVTEIARTLKCPVCESQSVADSPAQLAQEMRSYIQRRLDAGQDRDAIVQELVDRYGEGILLEPRRTGFTLLVWWLPWLSLGLGAVVVALTLRRATRPSPATAAGGRTLSGASPVERVGPTADGPERVGPTADGAAPRAPSAGPRGTSARNGGARDGADGQGRGLDASDPLEGLPALEPHEVAHYRARLAAELERRDRGLG